MNNGSKIRVRMAPSPTGFLHIGSARTALFNWLFAKCMGGSFILRIEDTDKERSTKEFEEDITNGLKWLGLEWDEFYRQSERIDVYRTSIQKLLDSGKAFWCYHTQEELETERKMQADKKEAPQHICEYRDASQTSLLRQGFGGQANLKSDGEKGIIRFSIDENSTRVIYFEDEIRGPIKQDERLLGDFSIAKSLNEPLYNLAAVVDDIDMKISHVIRGEDHISNTFKQILIYEALEESTPKFAHLPLILATDKSKLSKRNSQTALDEYNKDYLPEAVINFIAFLGYTYDKEIISKEEMIKQFDIKKVHKSGAIWNVEKLDWINSQYIKKLSTADFKNLVGVSDIPDGAIPSITERLDKLSDVNTYDFFWKEPTFDRELLKWKDYDFDKIRESLEKTKMILEGHNFNDKDSLRLELDDLSKILGGDRGLVYWPLRVALSGKEKSPDPVEISYILGEEKTLKRIIKAIDILKYNI